ncbi:hypothetical protein [Paraburkholderia saeva]|uniref:hypothetical protein n=1 Tax=Paraburkholderia saeva TaxID=2777537 RepID=UPI001DB7FE3A|nr:hypothetical protein [Paraburkholderia saeva]CAG4924623.1 hypothetical protein R52603_05284 [Paraburkholderia saeva]
MFALMVLAVKVAIGFVLLGVVVTLAGAGFVALKLVFKGVIEVFVALLELVVLPFAWIAKKFPAKSGIIEYRRKLGYDDRNAD